MRRVPHGSSPQKPLPPLKRQLRVYISSHANKSNRTKGTEPVNTLDNSVHSKEVRPRRIPYGIWKRIKIISIELGLTIPDTLDLLADIYEDLKRGELVEASKCWEVIER